MQLMTLNKYIIISILIIAIIIYRSFFKRKKIKYQEPLLEKFRIIAENNPESPALMVRKKGKWRALSYSEYYNQCIKFAKSLKALGLKRKSCVCIIGYNAPGYMIAHIGSIMANCIPVGIYTTNNDEMCSYILDNCKATVLVVEDAEYLNKFQSHLKSENNQVKHIMMYSDKPTLTKRTYSRNNGNITINYYDWTSFIKLGRRIRKLDNNIERDDPVALIYTSGTTSEPKGAIITYNNVNGSLKSMIEGVEIPIEEFNERFVSYLPLNHIAAQMIDIYMPIYIGGTVYIADKMALKGTLVDTIRACKPTIFAGVPRVWEKTKEKTDGKINIPLVYPLTYLIKYKMGRLLFV